MNMSLLRRSWSCFSRSISRGSHGKLDAIVEGDRGGEAIIDYIMRAGFAIEGNS